MQVTEADGRCIVHYPRGIMCVEYMIHCKNKGVNVPPFWCAICNIQTEWQEMYRALWVLHLVHQKGGILYENFIYAFCEKI